MTRRVLLALLSDNADGVFRRGPSEDHYLAERLLLRLLRDSTVAAGWEEASALWWYS